MSGYETYQAIKKDLIRCAVIGLLLLLIFQKAANLMGVGLDSTDGEKRSGMSLHTDALTGCQYLSVPGAGLTPRLDRDAFPICEGAKK